MLEMNLSISIIHPQPSKRNVARMGESALDYHQIWAIAEVHLLEFKFAKVRERRVVAESTNAVIPQFD